jgi:hypothetical protein
MMRTISAFSRGRERRNVYFTMSLRVCFRHHDIKKLAEIICHTKYFYNFAFGDYSDYCS